MVSKKLNVAKSVKLINIIALAYQQLSLNKPCLEHRVARSVDVFSKADYFW